MNTSIRYGTRAKLGFLLPSVNLASECQFQSMAPAGVSLHYTRLKLTSANEDELRRMADNLEQAVSLLQDAQVSCITFHCTAVSTMSPGIDAQLVERITRQTGIAATATGTAVIESMRVFGAKRVVLVTPYPRHVNEKEEAFLQSHGIEVLSSWAEGINDGLQMFDVPAEHWLTRVMKCEHPDADAYFLSCSQIKSPEIAQALEEKLGRPVITSNTAALWHSLRVAGLPDRVQGFGSLLSEH